VWYNLYVSETRIFISADTDRFAQKQRWTDSDLIRAVTDVEQGLHDGALGPGVYKRRIARAGSGKSGGFRLVIVLRIENRAFLVEAFAKNVKFTHTPRELEALRELASTLLNLSEEQIAKATASGQFRELLRTRHEDADQKSND
jgi:hypothetical protein